ncbi:MAG: crossover junction endodeoxyribonuclease RuvC [Clostridia bacterium]
MVVMGIDPGFAITGYGIVSHAGNKFKTLEYGVVSTGTDMVFSQRLLRIYERLNELVDRYHPDFIAVEELFFNTNAKTALKVGHGRGVAVLCAALHNIELAEYTPLQIKQAVCGYGRADKAQMQQMIKVLLNLDSIPKPDDAADALGVAICHAHSYNPRTAVR